MRDDEPFEVGRGGRRRSVEAPDHADPPVRERAGGVRRFTLLLLLLLVAVAAYAPELAPQPQLERVQHAPPLPLAPEGDLVAAYELARPATLRIEARCASVFRGGPLGVGSGFFVSPQGDVLTAYHVVESDAAAVCPVRYIGTSPDGSEVPLTLVGFDAYFDLAWLRAEVDHEVPFVPLALRAPQPGAEVVAIGNSRGAFLEPRAGRVTRLGVQANRADFADDTIELTASLAPGDSGGPVVNSAGEAVGVVSYISYSPGTLRSEAYVPPFLRGLGLPSEFASYAVPVLRDSELLAALREGERRDVPVIGFSWRPGFDYEPATGEWSFGSRPGPIVVQVAPGGPADAAGLRGYRERPRYDDGGDLVGVDREADVIVAVDGEPTPSFYDLMEVVRRKAIGETISLTVQRGRATHRLQLTLGAKREVFAGP